MKNNCVFMKVSYFLCSTLIRPNLVQNVLIDFNRTWHAWNLCLREKNIFPFYFRFSYFGRSKLVFGGDTISKEDNSYRRPFIRGMKLYYSWMIFRDLIFMSEWYYICVLTEHYVDEQAYFQSVAFDIIQKQNHVAHDCQPNPVIGVPLHYFLRFQEKFRCQNTLFSQTDDLI